MRVPSVPVKRVLVGGFLVLFAATLLYWLPGDIPGHGLHGWVYTEWLIDYSSGFTRRGLSGVLLSSTSGLVRPYILVTLLSWLIFMLVVFGYIRLVLKSVDEISPLCLAGILFLPSLLPFYMYDHGALGRKETIGYLIVLLHLLSLERRRVGFTTTNSDSGSSPRCVGCIALPAVVLLPVHILIHESSFLLFLPIHALITWSTLSRYRSLDAYRRAAYVSLLYLPVVIALATVVAFGRPSFDTAQSICERWEGAEGIPYGSCEAGADRDMWSLPGAFAALPWTLSEAASLTRSLGPSSVLAWLLTFSMLGPLTLLFGGMATGALVGGDRSGIGVGRGWHSARMGVKYFGLPLLASAPLYAVGWDYGRWFAVTCINYMMLSLSKEMNRLEYGLASEDGSRIGRHVAELKTRMPQGFRIRKRTRNGLILAVLLFVTLFVRMPHCCTSLGLLAEPSRSLIVAIVRGLGVP